MDGEHAHPPQTGGHRRFVDLALTADRRRTHWSLWLAAAIAAAAVVSVAVPVHIAVYELTGAAIAIAAIASVLQGGTLVLLLVAPRIAAAAHVSAALALAAATLPAIPWTGAASGLPWPLSPVSLIALLLLLLGLALRRRPILAIGATVAVLLPLTIAAIVLATLGLAPGTSLVMLTTAAGTAGAVNTLATVGLQLALARREVREVRHEAHEIDERRRWALERARIAREMHDVVAHSMSLVHMRATSARYRLEGVSDEVAEEFDGIALQARTALGEMRGLLGVLRDESDRLDAPQPGLGELADLIASARQAGLTVDASIPEPLPDASSAVQLALFRVAQEAFSNVSRHADGAPTRIRLEVVDEQLVLDVRNAAPGGVRGGADGAVHGGSPGGVGGEGGHGGGHGIRGMMERMTSVDGTLTHGRTPDGGYAVTARAPRSHGEVA